MKVGIDITPVIYQGTGVGTYTRELVRHLLPQNKKTHFVLFAATLRGQKRLKEYLQTLSLSKNFSLKIYPLPPLLTETAWNRLHRFPVENLVGAVDVFHAWDWQQPPSKKAKLVTTIHDLTPLKFSRQHHPKILAVHHRRLKWVKQEAAAIITDSLAVKKDIVSTLKIDKDKIHPIPLAASKQYRNFTSQKSEIKQKEIEKVKSKYNIKGDYLLSVGTREPRKNLDRVIKAFQLINNGNLTLVIAGKYGWGPGTRAKQGTGLASRIKILGYVETQNLPALYAGAKAFVYPSLYEGFGLPVLEAMSVGCPVVTSDKGSLKEVAGEAAIFVDPKSQQDIAAGIKTALADSSHLLATQGLKQSSRFSWEKTAQKTLKIYHSVL